MFEEYLVGFTARSHPRVLEAEWSIARRKGYLIVDSCPEPVSVDPTGCEVVPAYDHPCAQLFGFATIHGIGYLWDDNALPSVPLWPSLETLLHALRSRDDAMRDQRYTVYSVSLIAGAANAPVAASYATLNPGDRKSVV